MVSVAQSDHLSTNTYTTLNVEDTIITPAVLVVTNKRTLGVSGKSSLASSGKAEEDRHITLLALVGRRMKSQYVVLDWHLVEEHSEDTLLHLTSILGAEDDHLLFSEVDGDGGSRGHTGGVSVGWEGTSVVNDIVGVEMFEFLDGRTDKHVAHEQSMVSTGTDDSDSNSVAFIPSCKAIDDVDAVSCVQVVNGTFSVDSPHLQMSC